MSRGPGTDDDGRAAAIGRAAALHPYAKSGSRPGRTPDARLAEMVGLASAIGLDVVIAEKVAVGGVRPATYFGPGTISRFAEAVAAAAVDLVCVDTALNPIQQRNLERGLGCKVIDRTGLILEIFGARASTREGVLQVEFAQLTYQRSRLVRSWTHLERQRGGLRSVGGPGETQIEADRRMIDRRLASIRHALSDVVRTRALHRRARRRAPFPVVALVGYTNAGKSTLFNRMTAAGACAEDRLFATLDPAMRGTTLPSGRRVILSDTVGFVSDLPTMLVAAFRATLEEVTGADLILHVRDIAHPDSEAQLADVLRVLGELGVETGREGLLLEVQNKIDLVAPDRRGGVLNRAARRPGAIPVSARTGDGVDALRGELDALLGRGRRVVDIEVDLADGARLAWLYRHGDVIARRDRGAGARLRVGIDPADLARFERMTGPHA